LKSILTSEQSREKDFERESSRLNAGLKSCRAVVSNYRAMMSAEPDAAPGAEDPSEGEDSKTTKAFPETAEA
jgi:hypothetical protein